MIGCFAHQVSSFDPKHDLNDLTGKVVFVTGANTGIGYHTVMLLARQGAKVYLGARNEKKGREAITKMISEGIGRGQVEYFNVDLGDPRQAQDAAEEFLEMETRLDILINNAAQLIVPYDETKDGLSYVMSVNHFGTYILTRTLLPLMAQTSKLSGADVRIVTLSSVAHAMGRAEDKTLTFKELDDFKREYADDTCPGWSRYTVSKLANLLFARQLQKHIDKAGLDILSTYINPGEVNTFADRMPFPKLSKVFMGIFFAKPEQGAYTSCFAAASPLVRIDSGKYRDKYLVPVGKIGKLGKNAKREDLAVNLWTSTEKILEGMGIYMPEL